jgi:hypothetical protein
MENKALRGAVFRDCADHQEVSGMANVNDPNLGKRPPPLDPSRVNRRAAIMKAERIKCAQLKEAIAKLIGDTKPLHTSAQSWASKGAFSVKY